MANAAGRLRSNETQCGAGDAHNHLFGVDGSVIGKHGVTQLGDLATVICSYDQTAGYTSNSLASYFHDLGWRQRLYDLVQDWLLVSSSSSSSSTTNASTTTDKQQKQQQQQQQEQEEESARTKEEASSLLGVRLRVQHNASSSGLKSAVQSLGGNYGESTPSDLSFDVTAASLPAVNKVAADDCQADKDPRLVTYTNTISALSAAELVRRIALHREVSPELQFPNATWHDIQVYLYNNLLCDLICRRKQQCFYANIPKHCVSKRRK